jgi:hypothetical protein
LALLEKPGTPSHVPRTTKSSYSGSPSSIRGSVRRKWASTARLSNGASGVADTTDFAIYVGFSRRNRAKRFRTQLGGGAGRRESPGGKGPLVPCRRRSKTRP